MLVVARSRGGRSNEAVADRAGLNFGGTVKLTSNWFVCLPEVCIAHANYCFGLKQKRINKKRKVVIGPRGNAIANGNGLPNYSHNTLAEWQTLVGKVFADLSISASTSAGSH